MFGAFKGFKFRGEVSIYWHQKTGIPRNDLARITEVNSDILSVFNAEGLNAHDAGVRLSVTLFAQFLNGVALGDAEGVLGNIYGQKHLKSAVDFALFGKDALLDSYSHFLKGVVAFNYLEDNDFIDEFLVVLQRDGHLDEKFCNLLEQSQN